MADNQLSGVGESFSADNVAPSHSGSVTTSQQQAVGGEGSRTVTLNPTDTLSITLKVKEDPKKQVKFAPGTVDNEHMNKKSSKQCCIYHAPKAFDESSTESSSGSADDNEHAYFRGYKKKKKSRKKPRPSCDGDGDDHHHHHHDHDHDHDSHHPCAS